jgi:hypothetical protein
MNALKQIVKQCVNKEVYGVISEDDDIIETFESLEMDSGDVIDNATFYATEKEALESMLDGDLLITIQVKSIQQYQKVHKLIPVK